MPLLVQFGRSGLGKTSLLQAYLFKRLREKLFLPVMIRLNAEKESFTPAVARAIAETAKAAQLEHTAGRGETLWELLSTTTIWRGDLLLTPVLVFDQFEEVFTLHDKAFRSEVSRELGAVASGIPPDGVRAGADDQRRGVLTNLKIVISLREDFLGALQEFSDAIPGLFQERVRLEAFKEDEAREAISQPAGLNVEPGEEPYWTPRFTFEPAALQQMIRYLKGNSDVIEPFQLQLICRHVEAIAHRKALNGSEPVTVTTADFEGDDTFGSILSNFYRDTMRKLPRAQRKKAKRLCEAGLLGTSGHRLMLEEGQIGQQFRVKPEVLLMLAQERLIRRERRLDSAFYEISHDRLAESIFSARRFRVPASAKRLLWALTFVAAVVIVGFVWALVTREQAVRAREQAVRARANAEELLGFMLFNLRDELQKIYRLDLLEETTRRSLDYLDREIDAESPVLARSRSVALTTMGDMALSRGNPKGALDNFRMALEIDKKLLAAEPDEFMPREDMAITYSRIGDALSELDDRKGALDAYAEAKKLEELILRDSSSAESKRALARTHMSIGDVHLRNDDSAAAEQSFRQALAIGLELASADADDLESRNLVGSAHIGVGDARKAAQDNIAAAASYRRAVELAKEATSQNPTDDESQRILMRSHFALASFLLADDRSLALESYSNAITIAGRLAEANPRDKAALDMIRNIYDSVGKVAMEAGNAKGALRFYRDALDIAEKLLALDDSSLEQKNELSWSLVLVARAQLKLRDTEGARKVLERAVEIIKPVVEVNRHEDYLDTYAQALLMLGRNDEARSVVNELLARSWKDEVFLELTRKAGLR